MSVTINEQRTSEHDDDVVIELTSEEFHDAARQALQRLGLTYAELEEQAHRHDFESSRAQMLWMAIGGTVDL
ncbi:hypothetical protein ACFXJ5_10905 [Streptomyces sp. NPDC059373]